MKKLLHLIFSDYKFYRRKKGGYWYKIREYDVSGFAGPGEYWVQDLPPDDYYEVVGEENY